MNTNVEIQLADYRIVREAGRGAMSTVYEAVDERTGQTVALKVLLAPASLPPEQQRSLIARLQREARLIARLSHPNIVRILDVGEADGRHYLAMEYLHGVTLRQRLDAGPLPLAEASLVLDQVAAALDAIHPQRIVHRDIKPSNVMLLPDGHVKLMDFGVARQGDDTTITQTGMIVGSPAYMSPEQIRGEDGTPASDLWALGVLLYEMLAGRSPFPGTNIPAVLYKVTHDPPAPIPGVPPPVQQVLRKALEKKPSRRYRTARDFANALRATCVPLPVSGRRRDRSAPRRLPEGWPRVVLPAGGLLAVVACALLIAHASGHPHGAVRYQMVTTLPRMRTLPGVPAPPTPPVTIREQPPRLRLKTPRKPRPHFVKPAAKSPRALAARRKALHAERAWANHLARLARRSASHRHSRRTFRRMRHPRRHFFYIPRAVSPNYERQMPVFPVYNPQSPG